MSRKNSQLEPNYLYVIPVNRFDQYNNGLTLLTAQKRQQ